MESASPKPGAKVHLTGWCLRTLGMRKWEDCGKSGNYLKKTGNTHIYIYLYIEKLDQTSERTWLFPGNCHRFPLVPPSLWKVWTRRRLPRLLANKRCVHLAIDFCPAATTDGLRFCSRKCTGSAVFTAQIWFWIVQAENIRVAWQCFYTKCGNMKLHSKSL